MFSMCIDPLRSFDVLAKSSHMEHILLAFAWNETSAKAAAAVAAEAKKKWEIPNSSSYYKYI